MIAVAWLTGVHMLLCGLWLFVADEHCDAELAAVCGPVAVSEPAHKLKNPQMKKLHSGSVDASNQGAISVSAGMHHALAFAEQAHDTTELEQVSQEVMESMYGSVLEKLEAERSQKPRSWELLRPTATRKHEQIPEPPPPPTKKTQGASYAAMQRQLWPLAELRYMVKHWALASPGLPKQAKAVPASHSQFLGSVLDLLDDAALSRHVHKRTLHPCVQDVFSAATKDGTYAGVAIPATPTCPRADAWELRGKAEIVAWMTSDVDGCIAKHTRLRETEFLCLQFIMLYLRYCAAASVAVDSHLLLHSSLLPIIEENLDASIQDMETPHSLFALSISLVYAFTFVPGLRVLLDALEPAWIPPQRRSLAELCVKADQLVASYLSRLRAPSAPLVSAVPTSGGTSTKAREPAAASADVAEIAQDTEVADLQMLIAVRELVSSVSACVPGAQAVQEQEVHSLAASASVNRVEWSAMPSVVTWAAGTKCRGWKEHQQQRYVEAMQDIKLEAVPGLAQTHTYAKAAGAQVPPRRLAKRLMQELIAMQRDLPLSLEEVPVLPSAPQC